MPKKYIYNHIAPGFSELEWEMVRHIKPGGNRKDLPESIPSERVKRIRGTWWRTTLYWRLVLDAPSYTISTYFSRMGNGCFIHPKQDRLISIREWARLQSFKDDFIFHWTKWSQYKQIGNAVPPLLWRAIAEQIKWHLKNKSFVDLFAGAWWMSEWFEMEWFNSIWCIEIEKYFYETYIKNKKPNQSDNFILWDITSEEVRNSLIKGIKDTKVGVIVWWPPCQGFSLAWFRNPDDPRNILFRDYVLMVKKIKPEFFIMENVPWILSMQGGKVIETIMNEFRELWYHVNEPMLLNAEEYWVPQRRKRVIIIWSREKIIIEKPKILFSNSDPKLPKPITVREAIGNLPIIEAGGGALEMELDPKTKSSDYELLMAWEIDFQEFYSRKLRNISK